MSCDGLARIEAGCSIIAALDGSWPMLDIYRHEDREQQWVISYQYENTEPEKWSAETLDGATSAFLSAQLRRADELLDGVTVARADALKLEATT